MMRTTLAATLLLTAVSLTPLLGQQGRRNLTPEERAAVRKGQVGSGDRSQRVRTYNFPQNRCSDHRLGENYSLEQIIAGRASWDQIRHAGRAFIERERTWHTTVKRYQGVYDYALDGVKV